jgi:hypothetical protein
MDSYTDAQGVERCDNCGDTFDGCACYCSECGDHGTECACDEGPTLPPVADWARADHEPA